jgi:hypothetical protein
MKRKLLMILCLMQAFFLGKVEARSDLTIPFKEAWYCKSNHCQTWRGFERCMKEKDLGHSMRQHHPRCSKAFFEAVCVSQEACAKNWEEAFWCKKLAQELKREHEIKACNQNLKSYCDGHPQANVCKMLQEEASK